MEHDRKGIQDKKPRAMARGRRNLERGLKLSGDFCGWTLLI